MENGVNELSPGRTDNFNPCPNPEDNKETHGLKNTKLYMVEC